MLRFALLGSGSSGNAALVCSARAKVLIDAGLSLRQLDLRAKMAGLSLEGLDAILITHEHGDHCRAAGTLARRFDVPVYGTAGTLEKLPVGVGEIPRLHVFEAGDRLAFADMDVQSFGIEHDAADPVSFTVQSAGAKLGFATDIGRVSHLVRTRLAGSHALVLESNHCPEMLRSGPYPLQVQQRILGWHGHLSNQDMCSLLAALMHETLRTVVLVHVSAKNNTPELARAMAARVIGELPITLFVADQDQPTQVLEVRA